MEISEDLSLKNRKKLPEDIKSERNIVIFKNIITAIIITIYFILINLGCYYLEKTVFSTLLKIISFIILAFAISFFEKGYRKDNERIFLYGIELLFLAFFTLLMQYKIYSNSNIVNLILSMSFMYFSIYYIIKGLIQARNVEKKYSSTDIREIIEKEK